VTENPAHTVIGNFDNEFETVIPWEDPQF